MLQKCREFLPTSKLLQKVLGDALASRITRLPVLTNASLIAFINSYILRCDCMLPNGKLAKELKDGRAEHFPHLSQRKF